MKAERGKRMGTIDPFQKVFERNNTLRELNMNVETRRNIPDKVSELSIPRTHFDRQSHAHHK